MSADPPITDEEKADFLAETFAFCVEQCLDSPELMAEYRRLYGSKIGAPVTRSPIEAMVDRATGFNPHAVDETEARAFFAFVERAVWLPWLAMIEAEAKKRADGAKAGT